MHAFKQYIAGAMKLAGPEGLASFWVGAAVIAIVPGAGILWLIWCFLRTRIAARPRPCQPGPGPTAGISVSHERHPA